MSRVTKQKHVMREVQQDNFDLPEENQTIVRIVSPRGNNLHEVESADSEDTFLVTMPTKYRRNVWVKRGDFVLVEPIEEGDKVKAEIVRILCHEHVSVFTKAGIWPKKFTKKRDLEPSNSEEGDEDDEGLFRNTNHKRPMQMDEDESDSDSDSD